MLEDQLIHHMSPALSSGSGLIMFCCLFIICSSSLTTLSSSCHHLFHHVSVIFLSSLSCFTIFVHGYHLHMSLSSFCHLYHPPFLTLSSFLSSLSSSIPLLIICFVIFIILQPSSYYLVVILFIRQSFFSSSSLSSFLCWSSSPSS